MNKKYRINARLSEIAVRKLLAICAVTGKTKTAVIEDLIASEYSKNRKYEEQYYSNLDKKI